MSKKKVENALVLAETGAIDLAVEALLDVDRDFIRARLELAAAVPQTSSAAQALWARLFGSDVLVPRSPLPLQRPAGKVDALAAALPQRILLENPGPFLSGLGDGAVEVQLDRVEVVQIFALTGLAALARVDRENPAVVRFGRNDASLFGHAVGFDDAIEHRRPTSPGESGRTAKLRRLTPSDPNQIEQSAREIAALLLPGDEESRQTIKYVLVELIRNALQHSHDPLGGIVSAQVMDAQQRYARKTVQVAVGDAGIGVFAALRPRHPTLKDAPEALEKALQPHYSGAFDEGETGSHDNAGLGLFIISEMAKLTGGRLLLASREAALLLREAPDDEQRHIIEIVRPPGAGFPGTLVAFELPVGGVADFDAMFEIIKQKARERTPARQTKRWVRFGQVPEGIAPILISYMAEDTVEAQRLSRDTLAPRLLARKPVALDFRGVDVCTQSYLHALLFDVIRLAWALKVAVYALNTSPAVRSGLEMLENYALSG